MPYKIIPRGTTPDAWGTVLARSPYLGMILQGIKLLGCYPRGYFVLLGFRLCFELLKQVISPCPKMFLLLWYEDGYQHGINNPNTVLLLRPSSPEM